MGENREIVPETTPEKNEPTPPIELSVQNPEAQENEKKPIEANPVTEKSEPVKPVKKSSFVKKAAIGAAGAIVGGGVITGKIVSERLPSKEDIGPEKNIVIVHADGYEAYVIHGHKPKPATLKYADAAILDIIGDAGAIDDNGNVGKNAEAIKNKYKDLLTGAKEHGTPLFVVDFINDEEIKQINEEVHNQKVIALGEFLAGCLVATYVGNQVRKGELIDRRDFIKSTATTIVKVGTASWLLSPIADPASPRNAIKNDANKGAVRKVVGKAIDQITRQPDETDFLRKLGRIGHETNDILHPEWPLQVQTTIRNEKFAAKTAQVAKIIGQEKGLEKPIIDIYDLSGQKFPLEKQLVRKQEDLVESIKSKLSEEEFKKAGAIIRIDCRPNGDIMFTVIKDPNFN